MNNTQTFSTNLHCTLSDLDLCLSNGSPIATLQRGKPLQLKATLTFGDTVNDSLVKLLMPLKLTIRVIFYARPQSPKPELQLGTTTLKTIADRWQYVLSLMIEDPTTIGLLADETYQLGIMVSVGESAIAIPSLIRGYVEGGSLQQHGSKHAPEAKANKVDLPASVPAIEAASMQAAAETSTDSEKSLKA